MTRQEVWKISDVLFALAVFVCGLPVKGQQKESDARPAIQIGTFATFDAPGAGAGSPCVGTIPFAMNAEGVIAGFYVDASYTSHGFTRAASGAITTFDAPGAVYGTSAYAINTAGVTTGSYYDADFISHGFARSANGRFVTFDVPGAVTVSANAINNKGVIVGSAASHGFLRRANGEITTFDVPGSLSTTAESINVLGTISGCYTDVNSISHGFLRTADGSITTFDPPGSTGVCGNYSYYSPLTSRINNAGEIAGAYFLPILGNPFGGNDLGFVRSGDGSFATFSAATYPPCCDFTFATAINAKGDVAGYLNDGYGVNHGFRRQTNGTIITLDAPGATTNGGNFCNGTLAGDINAAGQVVGWYFDSSNAGHGYLWIP